MNIFLSSVAITAIGFSVTLYADEGPTPPAVEAGNRSKTVTMKHTTAGGTSGTLGTIRIVEKVRGIVLTPHLKGLSPGMHGFHLHENDDCGSKPKENKTGTATLSVAGAQAGDHYDPGFTSAHSGPYGSGHLGDLPSLYFDKEKLANHPVYAPRLRLRDLPGHALVIHANPDNYDDEPEKNGGSGAIVACGVVE